MMQITVNVPETLPQNIVQQFIRQFEWTLQKEAQTRSTSNRKTPSQDMYMALKRRLLKKRPELKNRNAQDIRKNFEQISEKIAANMPYRTMEDCVNAMRRNMIDEMSS